jgi:hypothetical protein
METIHRRPVPNDEPKPLPAIVCPSTNGLPTPPSFSPRAFNEAGTDTSSTEAPKEPLLNATESSQEERYVIWGIHWLHRDCPRRTGMACCCNVCQSRPLGQHD